MELELWELAHVTRQRHHPRVVVVVVDGNGDASPVVQFDLVQLPRQVPQPPPEGGPVAGGARPPAAARIAAGVRNGRRRALASRGGDALGHVRGVVTQRHAEHVLIFRVVKARRSRGIVEAAYPVQALDRIVDERAGAEVLRPLALGRCHRAPRESEGARAGAEGVALEPR